MKHEKWRSLPLSSDISIFKEYCSEVREKTQFVLESFTIARHYSAIRSADSGRTVGIIEDDQIFLIGDRVELRADSDGFIANSIIEEGMGVIVKIRINGNIRYGVQMDNGEFGYVTSNRIWKKINTNSDSE